MFDLLNSTLLTNTRKIQIIRISPSLVYWWFLPRRACHPIWPPHTKLRYFLEILNHSYFAKIMTRKPSVATWLIWPSCSHFWSQKSGICYFRGFCDDVTSHEAKNSASDFTHKFCSPTSEWTSFPRTVCMFPASGRVENEPHDIPSWKIPFYVVIFFLIFFYSRALSIVDIIDHSTH